MVAFVPGTVVSTAVPVVAVLLVVTVQPLVAPNVTLFNLLQPSNARLPIFLQVYGIVNVSIAVWENEYLPNSVTA